MNRPFDWLKQYHILIFILTLVFGASAVLIAFERVRNQEAAPLVGKAPNPSTQAVQGESIVRDQAVADYQQYAGETFNSIKSLISSARSGAKADVILGKQLESSLLAAKVPLPYRELHFGLLKIIRNLMADAGPNFDFLQEQTRLLADRFLWLSPIDSGGR